MAQKHRCLNNKKKNPYICSKQIISLKPVTVLQHIVLLMSQEWNRTEHLSPVLSFSSDDRTSNGAQMEFKSKQWFGASVRSDGEHILVRTSHLFFPHRDGSGVNVRVSLSVCLSVSPGLRSSLSVVHIWRDRKRTCWNLFSKERRNSGGVLALQIQFVPFTYCSILA